MDRSIIDIQKRILPDLLEIMQRRYDILRYIGLLEPVGRRSLSVSLGMTERVLRGEVDFLKEQNLIHVAKSGMSLTEDGKEILSRLKGMMSEITGIGEMEERLRNELSIEKAMIIPGDSDDTPWVKTEMGKACANCMKKLLKGENIIAVTGGSTLAAVAEMATPQIGDGLLFVPARGGFGEDVEHQANSICSKMAEKTGSKHRVLYVPDEISPEMYETFIKEQKINEVLQLIRSANMIIHGIGDALKMAERRKTSPEVMEFLKREKATGEAFGYYFDENGRIVHKLNTIGLQLEDLENAEYIIAVAGGSSKAKAIKSYMKQAPQKTILITDEGAAKLILQNNSNE